MLVSYSDSEDSDREEQSHSTSKPVSKPTSTTSNSNFAVDRSTGKIKVSLQSKVEPTDQGTHEDEPAAKRPRIGNDGGGAFSNFNAMLPAPKRDNLPVTQNATAKTATRKVFSLKTGAEPAFSRESDAELRELFAVQDGDRKEDKNTETSIPSTIPKPSFAKPAAPSLAATGKPFMFKPLSVARGSKKKKPVINSVMPNDVPKSSTVSEVPSSTQPSIEPEKAPNPPKKKVNLFTSDSDLAQDTVEDEIVEDLGPIPTELDEDSLDSFAAPQLTYPQNSTSNQHQDLSSIATDLNLSAAERRQLMGRSNKNREAVNVINFNTDSEYAANQQLIASGEQQQHNPVRAIASGKHSLRQLVTSAASQKEALEESFASGRRNKKEAGNKYGW